MAKIFKSIKDLQAFAATLIERPDRRYATVVDIIPTIIGSVIIHGVPGFHHGEQKGTRKEVTRFQIWFQLEPEGVWYYFGYDADIKKVRLKNGRKGATIALFDNDTTIFEINAVFKKLIIGN